MLIWIGTSDFTISDVFRLKSIQYSNVNKFKAVYYFSFLYPLMSMSAHDCTLSFPCSVPVPWGTEHHKTRKHRCYCKWITQTLDANIFNSKALY